ncbi:DNA topoisomerase I [Spiroplasma syrphidicola EA-1]|uniref:DNA topoisomerase 1 n=1 Tax=Spiroplasma syrphidicola EA-1 TaxID=1276229 RepID=R4U5D2_9MOLU|nr:type I DNA topoisomerase [Spiroplasma syrphidicola]AGM25793.1 DNA topoisomerase I [Spiroplasma syrphidicola EA-1]
MSNTLVIMESPTKTKAVQKYLGEGFIVLSSEGHIRNLATTGEFGLGVDINTFEPKYKMERNKKELVKELKGLAKTAQLVVLATDPDREGEAIAYHLNEVLGCQDKSKRVRFNEITKDAVLTAFENQTEIDMNLVKSQEARRILDRFIGFRLSKLLQKKIRSKSAGRVQSVALKLVVEREKEWQSFVPEEYWTIEGTYKKAAVKLSKYNNQKLELKTEPEVLKIKKQINNQFLVTEIKEQERQRKSPNPHTTSTMLQEASSKLGFASNKTSLIAQQLYEGIKVSDNITGFITYPRTDSIRLSEKFVQDAFDYITINYGQEYLGEVKTSAKKKNVQDAHEAIRPTDLTMTPEQAKDYLTRDQLRLYKIIYARSLASLMASAKLIGKTIFLTNNGYEFKMTGSTVAFSGFLKCYAFDDESDDEIIKLPNLKVDKTIELDDLYGLRHFTKPPSRYSEAKLIKLLEEIGVGRPSTYAPIMRTLKERGYIIVENKSIKATEKGILTSDKLQEFFNDIINETYTSSIEESLDVISNGELDPKPLLKEFWERFEPRIEAAMELMEEVPIEKAGIDCPNCGLDLVYRYGKYGKFIACSGFPKCRYIHQTGPKFGQCPDCGIGEIILKFNKRYQRFKACTNYPNCEYTDSYQEPKNNAGQEAENENTDQNGLYRIKII